jgi:hypothetical protein
LRNPKRYKETEAYPEFLEALDHIKAVCIRNLFINAAVLHNPGVLKEFLCESPLLRILGQSPENEGFGLIRH